MYIGRSSNVADPSWLGDGRDEQKSRSERVELENRRSFNAKTLENQVQLAEVVNKKMIAGFSTGGRIGATRYSGMWREL